MKAAPVPAHNVHSRSNTRSTQITDLIKPVTLGPPQRPRIISLAVSPDSKWVASGSMGGSVVLRGVECLDVATAGWMTCPPGPVHALAFSPDGERLVFTGAQECSYISVLSIDRSGRNGKVVSLKNFGQPQALPFTHRGATTRAVAWTSRNNAREIVVCCTDGSMLKYDPETKNFTALKESQDVYSPGYAAATFAVFSPNGSRLAFGGKGGRCCVWNVEGLEAKLLAELPSLSDTKSPIIHADFDRTGQHIVTCDDHDTLCVWSISTLR